MNKGAQISTCERYRYHLWRHWQLELGSVCWIMLNPSTADGEKDDATIRRCIAYTKAWGHGALEVVNLFALRSSKPQSLYAAADPVGGELNDTAIVGAAKRGAKVVCAWGGHGVLKRRDDEVLALLERHRVHAWALAVNMDGTPGHPLFLESALELEPFPVLV